MPTEANVSAGDSGSRGGGGGGAAAAPAQTPAPPETRTYVDELCDKIFSSFKKKEFIQVMQLYEELQQTDINAEISDASDAAKKEHSVLEAWGKAVLAADTMSSGDPEHVQSIIATYEERTGQPADYLRIMSSEEKTISRALQEFITYEAGLTPEAVEGALQKYDGLSHNEICEVLEIMKLNGNVPLTPEVADLIQNQYVQRMRLEDPEVVLAELKSVMQPTSVRPYSIVFNKPTLQLPGKTHLGYYFEMLNYGIKPVDSTWRILIKHYYSQPVVQSQTVADSSAGADADGDDLQASMDAGDINDDFESDASELNKVRLKSQASIIAAKMGQRSASNTIYLHFTSLQKNRNVYSHLYQRALSDAQILCEPGVGETFVRWIELEGGSVGIPLVNRMLRESNGDEERVERAVGVMEKFSLRPTATTMHLIVVRMKGNGNLPKAERFVLYFLKYEGSVDFSSIELILDLHLRRHNRHRAQSIFAHFINLRVRSYEREVTDGDNSDLPEPMVFKGSRIPANVAGSGQRATYLYNKHRPLQIPVTTYECMMRFGPFDWSFGLLGMLAADGLDITSEMRSIMSSQATDETSKEIMEELRSSNWKLRRILTSSKLLSQTNGNMPSMYDAMRRVIRELMLPDDAIRHFVLHLQRRVELETSRLEDAASDESDKEPVSNGGVTPHHVSDAL